MLAQTREFVEFSMAEITFVGGPIPRAAISLVYSVVNLTMPSYLLCGDSVTGVARLHPLVDIGAVDLWGIGTGASL
jgi:hypothetical protein